MAFGMPVSAGGDFTEIVKFDARAGRLHRVDYDQESRTRTPVDITLPPPRFAVDFGTLEVGYGRYEATGPDFRVVPEGQPLPAQPTDKDDKGRLAYRPVFRVKLFGKVLDGLREFSSAAGCVLESMDALYSEFRAAPEAAAGQVPIVELTRTTPVTMGRGVRATTVYAPVWVIVGWTARVGDMGERTVPPPKATTPVPTPTPAPAQRDELLEDEIPF